MGKVTMMMRSARMVSKESMMENHLLVDIYGSIRCQYFRHNLQIFLPKVVNFNRDLFNTILFNLFQYCIPVVASKTPYFQSLHSNISHFLNCFPYVQENR
ncbi:hypothetical protein PMAYCL1PPCAC_08166, partial [Pristionchus mayeri]